MDRTRAELQHLLRLREDVKARQQLADEARDQDTVLVMNMLQDRCNTLLCGELEVVPIGATDLTTLTCHLSLKPVQGDASSISFYITEFVAAVLDMDDFSEPIPTSIYQGLYLPQAESQLISDIRESIREVEAA